MKKALTTGFLLAEAILYWLILTTGGQMLVWSSYLSILLCLLFSLTGRSRLITGALACTAGADFFLVVSSPIQRLSGMVCFLCAQALYAAMLHRNQPSRIFLSLRAGITALAVAVTVLVLREKTDALALVSICYYANLIINLITAIAQKNKLFSVALVLFLLCDTVIGLQVAAGNYLPIAEGSLLHRILFMDFNLAWFFYLPSQVLIVLSSCFRPNPSK